MLKRYTKYAHTDPHPQVQFASDDAQSVPGVAGLVFALSVIGLFGALFARATGVDLYRMLQIVWGV